MSEPDDANVAQDGWVSFSDVLLTLVCAVLFLRTLAAAQDVEANKTRDFEARLRSLEKISVEVHEGSVSALNTLRQLIRSRPSSGAAESAPPVRPQA